jgi:cysteine-rich repeat protein
MRRHSRSIVVAAATILVACGAVSAQDIMCGQTIERTIERSGQSDTLAYDGGIGDVLSITIVPVSQPPECVANGQTFNPYWEFFDPDGNRVPLLSPDGRRCLGLDGVASCVTKQLPLTASSDSGFYTLVVTDTGKNCAGTYRVTVENVSPTVDGQPVDPAAPQCARFNDNGKPDGTQPIGRGDPIGGAIDEIGETDTFTFEGQQGETVEIVLATSDGGTFAQFLHWALFGPDFDSTGSNAVSGECAPTCDDSGVCTSVDCTRTLGSAGVYTIEVFDAQANATGSYTLTLSPQDATTTTTTPTTTTAAPSTTTTSLPPGSAAEQTLYELVKTLRRTPSSFALAEKLGASLASDGNQLVIGAPWDQTQGGGAAFVVNLTDQNFGHLDNTLYKPGGSKAGDDFGQSVALLPDSMVAVGAPGADDTASGAGEVYLYGPGSPSPLLHPSLAGTGSAFGTSLFVTPGGNELFVGAPAPTRSDGRVFLFDLDPSSGQWGLANAFDASQAATPSPARSGDQFGFAVAATADQLAIGAPATTTNNGRVFLYDRRTGAWQILQSPSPKPGDGFGSALVYVNSTLFIGVPGAAQVFQFTGGAQGPVLFASGSGRMGAALAPSPDGGLFVGAPFDGSSGGGVVVRLLPDGQLAGTFAKPQPDPQDQYGTAIVAAGGRLFIGAILDDSGSVDGGAVYAYQQFDPGTRDAIFRKRLTNAGFGTSVSANAAATVVGAPTDDNENGAAYLFDPQDPSCTNDTVCPTIGDPKAGTSGSRFGQSVAMVTGQVALVGAPFENGAVGAAYLMQPASLFSPQIKNPGPAPLAGDQFGFTVAAVDTHLLIAAPLQGTTDAGKVYVFDDAQSPPKVVLSKPVSATGDFFGAAIADEGDTVAVGAPFDSTAAPHAGAVYLFSRSTGQLLAGDPLVSSNPTEVELFGAAVAMSADLVVVGAPGEDGAQQTAGRVYVFQRQSPDLPTSLLIPLPPIENPRCSEDSVGCLGDRFGAAVAIVDGQVLIGAPRTDSRGGAQDTGVAYLVDPSSLTPTQIDNPAQGAFDRFGSSVASGPSGPIIGAPGPNRVYVYSRKTDGGTTSLAVRNAFGSTAAASVASGPRCGDGNVDPGEQCDDGNKIDTDDCRNDCTLQSCCVIDPLAADRCNDFDPCTDDSVDPNTGLCVNVNNGQCCTSDSSCAGDSACRLCAGCSLFPWDCCNQGSTCILDSPQCQDKTCFDEAACECSELTCSDESTPPDKRSPTQAMTNAFKGACVDIQAAQNGGTTGNPMATARTNSRDARKMLKSAMHETRRAYKNGDISKQCRAQFIEDIRRVRKSVPIGARLRKCVTKSGTASSKPRPAHR